jgi:hypothetical protein
MLQPGTWRVSPAFPVKIAFDVPDGFSACVGGPTEQGTCSDLAGGGGITFLIVENVVADPCGDALAEPPVGPSVDDLVGAISNLDGFTATKPIDVKVDGYKGKQIEVTAPSSPTCGLNTWATADRTNSVGPGESNVLQIVDVDGARVLIAEAYSGTTDTVPADTLEKVDAILASVQITK